MAKYSKKPSFKATGLDSPITEFVFPLMSVKDDDYYPAGTAVTVGKYLAVTAKHVVDSCWQRHEKQIPPDSAGEFEGTFSLEAVQILQSGKEGALWKITRIWKSPFNDIAFLELKPGNPAANKYKWRCPTLNLLPPEVSTRIAGFGYHSQEASLEEQKGVPVVHWRHSPTTTIGEVTHIYERRRDSVLLPFACFSTNAKSKPGMSGGPIFNDEGELCGIISTGLDSEDSAECISNVVTLWPAMGTYIGMNRAGHAQNILYPVLELARDGLIKARNWERVSVRTLEHGVLWRVELRT